MHTIVRPSSSLAAGGRAALPWLAGIAPFGFVVGVTGAERDLPALAVWLAGPLVFAGSAQLAVLELVDAHAAIGVVVLTTFAINLRLLFYGAAMAPHWSTRSLGWRLGASAVLIDPTFAIGSANPAHYVGGAVAVAVTWLGSITLGLVAGGSLPAGLGVGTIVPLFLCGELAVRPRTPAWAAAIVVGGAVAVVAQDVPHHLGTVVAIVAGVSAALLTEARSCTR